MIKRILVADDEARVLLILHETLRRLGNDVEIVTAHNGLEALKRAREKPFDLVITDLRMTGMGGIELTRAIKTANPETMVIWITAFGCHKASAELAKLGVYRCLDKPLEIKRIRQAAAAALGESSNKFAIQFLGKSQLETAG